MFSVEGVLDALAAQPRRGGGRALMFVSARGSDAVTARATALAAAEGASTYAIDLDLKRNALAKTLSAVGPLGPKIDGRLNAVAFFAVRDARGAVLRQAEQVFSYHRVGRMRLYAGIFDAAALPGGARVHISAGPEYWDAARAGGANIVLQAPSLDRSQIALRVARHMDGVVLVVGSEPGAAPAAMVTKALLADAGANLIGLVYAGASAPVMAIERLLRQAG
jgi:hypothetical protein